MKMNQKTAILISTSILFLTTWCLSNALADGSLVAIPLLGTGTNNEARAITPDGVFVVGALETTNGFLYNVTNGYVVQPVSGDGYPAKILTGVAYRIDTNQTPPQTQLIMSGLDTVLSYFMAWMTTDGGTNFDYAYYRAPVKTAVVPLANGLAGTSWDVLHAAWSDQGPNSGDNWYLFVGEFAGPWVPTVGWDLKSASRPSLIQMNGISGNGRGLGWRLNSGAYITYIADYNGPNTSGALWSCRGLDGTTAGQAWSVNANGTVIFGISPKGTATGGTNYGFKATFDTFYPGQPTQLSTNQLPIFSDATGVTNVANITNLAIPFGCTPDGKFAVGMTYRGRERAVLWDTSDADTNKWTVTDLTDLAVANGILGNFTNLSRAYSIGTNSSGAKVVVGIGRWSEDAGVTAFTRGFVMVVPTATAVVRPTVSISTTPQRYTFSCQSVSGKTYYLECTTNLVPTNWSTLGSTPGTGSPVSLTDLNPTSTQKFYRVRIQ